jgi:hypothetical protein
MAFTEDLGAFLLTDDFAITVTIGGASVNGLWDNADAITFNVAGTKPTFLCKESDVAAISIGTTTLTNGSTVYTIIDSQPDGHGLVSLILEAV